MGSHIAYVVLAVGVGLLLLLAWWLWRIALRTLREIEVRGRAVDAEWGRIRAWSERRRLTDAHLEAQRFVRGRGARVRRRRREFRRLAERCR